MKALSVLQPWASLIVCGAKRYETRSRQTSFRGWIAIHASKAFPMKCRRRCYQHPFMAALCQSMPQEELTPDNMQSYTPLDMRLPLGAIVGFVNLSLVYQTKFFPLNGPPGTLTISAEERAFGDWSLGRWAWRLDKPHMLKEPIPARGALGLWEWEPPAEVAAWLRELEVQS